MASWGGPPSGVPQLPGGPGPEACSDSPGPEPLASFEDPAQVSRPDQSPSSSEDSLPRNVASERSRRKRISTSCEQLRALLPRFSSRREDMASVLEMAVQFLQLAHALVPGWEQLTVPTGETWHVWQEEVLHLTLASQAPDSRRSRPGRAPRREPARAPLTVEKPEAPAASPERPPGPAAPAALPERPPPLPEPQGPDAQLPPWPVQAWLPASPLLPEEDLSGLPLLMGDPESPGGPAEAAGAGPAPLAEARLLPVPDLEDGRPFLMTASPGWWQGPAEGLGDASPAPGRPADPAELDILGEPEDGSLELWSSDLGSWGSELRDEADAIFPDLFS